MTQHNLLSLGLPRRHLGVAFALAVFAPACGDDGAGSGGTGGAGTTTVASTGSTSVSSSASTSGTTSSGATGSTAATTATTSTGTGAMLDLANGTWAIDQISNLHATMFNPSLVRTADDEVFAAYSAEPLLSPSGVRVEKLAGDWSEVLVDAGGLYPDLQVVGENVWLVSVAIVDPATPEGSYRSKLSLAIAEAGTFSAPVDLTSGFHPTGSISDPVIVPLSSGGAAVVYMFSDYVLGETTYRIETLFLDPQGNPLGAPVVVFDEPQCDGPAAARAPNDEVVVVGRCWDGANPSRDVMAIGSSNAPFVTHTVPQPTGDSYYPKVAVDSQGRIHLAWSSWCGADCTNVRTASGTPGAWGSVTQFPENALVEQVAIDPWDRPIILSTSWDGTQRDISLRYAPDGTTYAPPIVVTPDSPQLHDAWARSIVFRASDGGPELAFLRSPLDDEWGLDVYRATFVPN